MVRHFGSDIKPGALTVAIHRHIKPLVKQIRDCVEAGGDVKDLKIGKDEMIDRHGNSRGGPRDRMILRPWKFSFFAARFLCSCTCTFIYFWSLKEEHVIDLI